MIVQQAYLFDVEPSKQGVYTFWTTKDKGLLKGELHHVHSKVYAQTYSNVGINFLIKQLNSTE
ncbi:MAG: hypothetical protein ACW967_04905 [Candidatus Hodarchaeales archaeon]|jgi:hypothetical protein